MIHFHVDLIHFPFFKDIAQRTVTTLHGRLDLKDLAEVYRRWPLYRWSRSRSIRDGHCRLPTGSGPSLTVCPKTFSASTPNPRTTSPFSGASRQRERLDRAIAIAKRLGVQLRIAAKVDAADKEYFTQMIELLSDPLIEFVGEIGDAEKSAFLGQAIALLFPIDWPEPFGLVMIEAMACGTPVVAWRCGSVPEVIDDGVTGYIVASEDEAVAAVQQAALPQPVNDPRCLQSTLLRHGYGQ